ncbi:hypothetical protein PO909_026137 [Leuciscus waleckii]
MKSTEVDQGLFTDSYCKVCSAQLISESQRVAHYEVRPGFCLHPVCLYIEISLSVFCLFDVSNFRCFYPKCTYHRDNPSGATRG